MIINVTQDHIDKGVKKICCYCPVALALKDAGLFYAESGYLYLSFGTKDRVRRNIMTPEIVVDFIKKFDSGMPVEPFSFEIDI